MTITLQALSPVKKATPAQVRFKYSTYAWGTNGVSKWKMDLNYPNMTSNESIMFHGHLDYIHNLPHHSEVGLTQNRKTITLQNLTTCRFPIFLSCARPPHEHKFIGIASGWGHGDIWLHTLQFWGPVTTRHEFGSLETLSCGLSQLHGHGCWLVCDGVVGGGPCARDGQCMHLLSWISFPIRPP